MTTAPLPTNQSQEKLKNCRVHFPALNTDKLHWPQILIGCFDSLSFT